MGAAIFAVTVACALLVQFGERRFRDNETLDWQVAGWTVVLGGLLAIGLQIWQLTELPFFPGSSGYASCFIAWGAMNIALILSGIYWIETILAREIRLRRAMAEDGGAPNSALPVAQALSGQSERLHLLLGLHRPGVSVLLGTLLRDLSLEDQPCPCSPTSPPPRL